MSRSVFIYKKISKNVNDVETRVLRCLLVMNTRREKEMDAHLPFPNFS